jgi:hypothetical protein
VSDADLARSGCDDCGQLNDVVSQRVRVLHSFGTLQDYMVRKNDEIIPLALRHSREITNAYRFEIGELKAVFHSGLPQLWSAASRCTAPNAVNTDH